MPTSLAPDPSGAREQAGDQHQLVRSRRALLAEEFQDAAGLLQRVRRPARR